MSFSSSGVSDGDGVLVGDLLCKECQSIHDINIIDVILLIIVNISSISMNLTKRSEISQ